MKSTIAILAFLFTLPSLLAQSYAPMLRNDVLWEIVKISADGGAGSADFDHDHITLNAGNDTLANGFLYKGFSFADVKLREDTSTGKVYRFENDTSEVLWLDFSLSEGDTFTYHHGAWLDSSHFVVDSVRSVTVENETRKAMYLSSFDSNTFIHFRDVWIEGIGSNGGPGRLLGSAIINYTVHLGCYRYKDDPSLTPLYGDWCTPIGISGDLEHTVLTLHPNPASHLVTVSGLSDGREYRVLNLLGQEVSCPQNSLGFDVSALESGTYLLTAQGAKRSEFIKFIVEH